MLVQLQRARTQMIGQAVAHLIVGDAVRLASFPVQHPYAIPTRLRGDDVQYFAVGRGAYFQTRQVAHFVDQRTTRRLCAVDLAHALTLAVVDIALFVIEACFALHSGDLLQLVAYVPTQGLAAH
ncbi:hypothetical protein ALO52_200162 [Pseudomonas syringae pv. primulae]|uniref:Phage antirepressor protein n=1 Tax=Pseudomonas syringae pv. primulae TaxID=251707 RepID=A0A0P9Y9Z5_9PSED|nr:hypothetical protein ALO52_200162 [Pseudomonas syringae pv. primulae]